MQDLFGLLADRASAWQYLWNVFYTVSAAIVAIFASGKRFPVRAVWAPAGLFSRNP